MVIEKNKHTRPMTKDEGRTKTLEELRAMLEDDNQFKSISKNPTGLDTDTDTLPEVP